MTRTTSTRTRAGESLPLLRPFTAACLWLTALTAPLGLPGQTAPKASPPAGSPESDESIISLSPFVVSTETERGYQATETLAGMRIRTNLKDVGAAIDVLTESFLNDVGAVDMLDALKYVANMQYATVPHAGDTFNNAQYFSTQYLSRGILGGTVLIDYFPTGAVQIDRYNVDNMTMMRGPNAILFGIGSPSGVVGSSSKRALLHRNQGSVRLMGDSNESFRAELDLNRVLIKNKLALRVAAVTQNRHTRQTPSRENRDALYATLTYKPFSKTRLTVSAEKGHWDRLHVMNSIVADAYTPWVLAGKPMVSSKNPGGFSTAVGSGLQQISTGSYLVYVEGSNAPIQDWRGMARGAQWGNTVPSGPAGSGLMLEADRGQMNSIGFNHSNAITDLYANWWGDQNTNDLDYHVESVFIEQNILPDLDVELAWNRHTSNYAYYNFGSVHTIWVDPNLYLPDGTPNPNAGRPYIETGNGGNGSQKTGEWREFENKRVTLSYELRLDDHKIFRNVGFGNYRFAGMYQEADFHQKLLSSRFVNVTPLPGNSPSSPLNQNQNRLSRRYYLTPGESTFRSDDQMIFKQAAVLGNTPETTGPLNFEERMSDEAPRNNLQNTESWVAAVQGAWWARKDDGYYITGMFGYRADTQRNQSQSFARNPQGEYAVPVSSVGSDDYRGLEQAGTWNPPTEFDVETKSYNVTVRPLSFLRVFYNYSDIFRSNAANFTDVFNRPLRPAFGETNDYGVKLDLWKERIYVTATKYETSVVDQTFDNGGSVAGPLNDIYNAISRPDLVLTRPFTYRNDSTKGYEFALTAAITKNWNTRLTVGTQKTIVATAFEEFVEYIAQNRAFLEQQAAVPLLNPGAGYATGADALARADQRLRDARAIIGQQPPDQREFNSSLNTTYRFSEGPLKGVRIGAGYRWASANVLGYARTPSGALDTSKPFKGPEYIATDANIGYSRKLSAKYEWDIQLNVFNVLNDRDILPRIAVDNGQGKPIVTRTYLPEPISFQLTSSIRF